MAETIWNTVVMVFHFIMKNIVIINILLSLIIVFFERRSPQAVWTWLLLLYFIPIVGFILYLIIGQDYHKNKMFKAKEIEGELKYAVRRQEETIYHRQLKMTSPALNRFRDLVLYNLEAGQAVLTDNNDIRIYTDGKEKFYALIEEMKRAKKYIHVQYYIIRNDEVWQDIEKVLIEKAREGVEVRVLFDSMGCRSMHKKDWDRLKCEGIRVAEFFPAILGQLQMRVNYRNHRKIVVIDGKVGFVGGFNIGREYIGKDEKFGKTYQEYFHLHYSKQGIFLGADERTDVIERELQLCGYFCIITSEKMTASQALIQYKGRDISEKLFQSDKTFIGSKSERVQSSQSMSSKIFIEFVALIVRNRIYNLLKEQMIRMETKQKYMTVPAAIRELEKIEMVRRNGRNYKLDHAVTRTQKLILNSFGLDETDIQKRAEEYGKLLNISQSYISKEAQDNGEEEDD